MKIGSILYYLCKLLLGVAQGSVLDPLLFSLYTTFLSLVVSNHKGIKYYFCSEVNVHLSQKNTFVVFQQFNRCLNDAKEWTKA